jgi:hypothetical protein
MHYVNPASGRIIGGDTNRLPQLEADYPNFHADRKRNRSSIFAFVAFSDGKPDSTFPENALDQSQKQTIVLGYFLNRSANFL